MYVTVYVFVFRTLISTVLVGNHKMRKEVAGGAWREIIGMEMTDHNGFL